MQFFTPDATRLTYRRAGTGAPLVCVPGAPFSRLTTSETWAA